MADPLNRLDELPTELLYETLYHLSYKDIENVCESNPAHKSICDDPLFWIGKARFSFPEFSKYIDNGLMGNPFSGSTRISPGKLAKHHYLALVQKERRPVSEFSLMKPRIYNPWDINQVFRIHWINMEEIGKVEYLIDTGKETVKTVMKFLPMTTNLEYFKWFVKTYKDHPATNIDFIDLNDPKELLSYAVEMESTVIIKYLQETNEFVDADYIPGIERAMGNELDVGGDDDISLLILPIIERNPDLTMKYIIHVLRRHRFDEELIERHMDIIDGDLIDEVYSEVLSEDPDKYFMHELTGLMIRLDV